MSHRLNIAFFGSSLLADASAAAYYRGLIRALRERGHRITFYEPEVDEPDLPGACDCARLVGYEATDEAALEALEDAEASDLIVKCSGVGFADDLLEAAVLELKKPETLVAFLDLDAAATLERLRNDPDDLFRPLIPEYDFILTLSGGPVLDAYLAAGAVECLPLYPALDPHTHFPVAPDPRFAGALGFLGSRPSGHDARAEEFFLKAAERLPAEKFLVAGEGWREKPLPANVHAPGGVPAHEENAFHATPRAALAINGGRPFSPPARVFEAAGAGACLIIDPWTGLEQFLEPGREVLVAADGDAVAEHLAQLTPERAQEIGRAAHRRILSAHTYAHRVGQLEKLLAEKTGGVAV